MKRFAMERLEEWMSDSERLPLIIHGARQTGKTWLMKEFGRTYFEKCAYINFDRNRRMQQLFSGDFNVDRILQGLAIESDVEIEPENTLERGGSVESISGFTCIQALSVGRRIAGSHGGSGCEDTSYGESDFY